ncbi:hypothetical protein JQC92_02555 [Shewanella sp. 202IG2-18]|uniref:hypothetical protein n=1 Tax=Parashewanella hymeniacidonis TaxID=2807618 RepID=UPI001960D382|nr:hypothetical protein [Parashewanella hymeniacidonis]MBM7070923.1 hypothetical protein [Parashewanella hymeniacidonis]
MQKPKFYCPYCKSEMLSDGSRHVNDNEAWEAFNCDFPHYSDPKPLITELEMKQGQLPVLMKKRRMISKGIKETKERIAELEQFEANNNQ